MGFNQHTAPLDLVIELLGASVLTLASDPYRQVDPAQRGYIKIKGSVLFRSRDSTCYIFSTQGNDRYVSLYTSPKAANSNPSPTSSNTTLVQGDTEDHSD